MSYPAWPNFTTAEWRDFARSQERHPAPKAPASKTLGGQGSGNFGHAGRPGVVGGSATMTLFHGTSSQALAAIKKEGIKPHGGPGADQWAIDRAAQMGTTSYFDDAERNGLNHAVIADRKASVFLTEKESHATTFADYAAEENDSEPVILKLEVPTTGEHIVRDELSAGGAEWRFRGTIKPEWIKGRLDPDTWQLRALVTPTLFTWLRSLGETQTLYLVFLVDGKDTTD